MKTERYANSDTLHHLLYRSRVPGVQSIGQIRLLTLCTISNLRLTAPNLLPEKSGIEQVTQGLR